MGSTNPLYLQTSLLLPDVFLQKHAPQAASARNEASWLQSTGFPVCPLFLLWCFPGYNKAAEETRAPFFQCWKHIKGMCDHNSYISAAPGTDGDGCHYPFWTVLRPDVSLLRCSACRRYHIPYRELSKLSKRNADQRRLYLRIDSLEEYRRIKLSCRKNG